MTKKTKLELTWPGKDERPQLEPRILIEHPDKSYRAAERREGEITDNLLIKGDNLLALKALEADYAGKVNCVYIDPPFNTGAAFEHYYDGLEHSIWLNLMRERLEIIRRLLAPTGFLCAHIDDSEGHYLKVLLDEVFGRGNYLTTFYIQVRYPQKTLKQDMDFHKEVEMVHIYRRDYGARPQLNEASWSDEKYCFYVQENSIPERVTMGGKQVDIFRAGQFEVRKDEPSNDGLKEIWATGTILDGNSSGRFFRDFITGRSDFDGLGTLYKVYGIGDDNLDYRYFSGPKKATATKGKYYQGIPKSKLLDLGAVQKSPIENFYDLAGSFGNCRHEGGVEFRSGKKPEKLLEIVLKHFSQPGDLVLDSFAGSGTTGAVAHKMRRQWIMIEIGDHADSHIAKRLKSVVEGTDATGVSDNSSWRGGGGFRYFTLAPSLLNRDRWGNLVISKEYDATMLAEAMCKHLGYTYSPSQHETEYWQHGQSSEADFLYVTTQSLTHDALKLLSEEVGAERTLMICARAFSGSIDAFPNLSCRKIPSTILTKCEWGRDDYSLNVGNGGDATVFDVEEEAADA